jgi:ATP phosphoribosyltransferase regulatory subunit
MSNENRWLLPEGIDELLPERASRLEALRRSLLDHCETWGYRYVVPPLVEFTDSLLIGVGADLDLVTCKFSDRMSGRMLGVRADITPQVARMDAHSLGEDGVTRLCYVGSTLQSVPQAVVGGRAPIQLGAELFGSASTDADSEIVTLLLSTLERAQVQSPLTLDIGHIGIYDALFSDLALAADVEQQIFDALQRKSAPDIERLAAQLAPEIATKLTQLASLHGAVEIIDKARALFSDNPVIVAALDHLDAVVARVKQVCPAVSIYVDLTELRGFRYHTGLVFAVYVEGRGSSVAKGGRYDNIGAVFGRDRPATGFAIDLKALVDEIEPSDAKRSPIVAPRSEDPALLAKMTDLREEGRIVIVDLESNTQVIGVESLVYQAGEWVVVAANEVSE